MNRRWLTPDSRTTMPTSGAARSRAMPRATAGCRSRASRRRREQLLLEQAELLVRLAGLEQPLAQPRGLGAPEILQAPVSARQDVRRDAEERSRRPRPQDDAHRPGVRIEGTQVRDIAGASDDAVTDRPTDGICGRCVEGEAGSGEAKDQVHVTGRQDAFARRSLAPHVNRRRAGPHHPDPAREHRRRRSRHEAGSLCLRAAEWTHRFARASHL